MAIIFYDHLINKTEIYIHLDNLDVKPKKKERLKEMVDDIFHSGIIEFILQKLQPHHHRKFIKHLDHSPYDPELINFLKKHIDEEIEDQITKQAEKIKKLVLKDLK